METQIKLEFVKDNILPFKPRVPQPEPVPVEEFFREQSSRNEQGQTPMESALADMLASIQDEFEEDEDEDDPPL